MAAGVTEPREEPAMQQLAGELGGTYIEMPILLQTFDL
jgi:hypothetical protein